MPAVSRITALFCGVALGLLFFAGQDATARVTNLAPTSWAPPTPAEGTMLQARAGDLLRFSLAALALDSPGATITIGAAGVPPGATFRTTPGNPAAAGFLWVPRPANAGRTYSLTFTAQPDDQAVPSRTRRVDVHVVARKATRFALSSGATATYRWAFVIRRVIARSAPSRSAAPVTRLRLLTPEKTTNLVQAIEGRRTASGRRWVRVRLAILPNNSTGWVPKAGAWRPSTRVFTHLSSEIEPQPAARDADPRGHVRFFVARRSASDSSRWPTPKGEFYVRDRLARLRLAGSTGRLRSAQRALGRLTDWPGGGFVGIHGTNEPYLLPGPRFARLHSNEEPRHPAPGRLMRVGTPVTIS